MKKLLTALFALSLVVPMAPVLAQDAGAEVKVRADTNSPVRVKMETRAEAGVTVRKASSTESRASSTEKRMMTQQNVAKRMVSHVKDLLTATAERLGKIADRVESRIAKVKDAGGDTTLSERFLAEARTHLTEARAAISVFASISLTSDKMSENVAKLRAAAADAKEHLGEARQSLSESIKALKPGRAEVKVRATSTATTTNQ